MLWRAALAQPGIHPVAREALISVGVCSVETSDHERRAGRATAGYRPPRLALMHIRRAPPLRVFWHRPDEGPSQLPRAASTARLNSGLLP